MRLILLAGEYQVLIAQMLETLTLPNQMPYPAERTKEDVVHTPLN